VNDPIDSRQLQIFLCLATKGSLKAAAAELFLTSSAISHSITNLEASLGVSLFHRSGKGLMLTPKGEFLRRKSIPLIAQMNNIRSALTGDSLADRASLRIAAGYNFLTYRAPDIVREFNECFPRGSLTIRGAEREKCLKLLLDRDVDAVILVDPPEDGPDFSYTRLFEDELKLLMHTRNPLAGLEMVPIADLNNKSLVVSRLQSYTTTTIVEQARRKGVAFRECFEVGNTAAIYEMVKTGQGIALLPDWILKLEEPSPLVVARSVSGIRLTRTWAYVEPTWKTPNLAGRTFKRLCIQSARGRDQIGEPGRHVGVTASSAGR
jgi:LysR family transcriptional regulator for metE and metH